MNWKHTIILFLVCCSSALGQYRFTLPLAIEYAVENSIEMKKEKWNVIDAEERVKEFKAFGMPQLDAGVNYAYYFIRPSQPTEDFLTPAVFGILNEFVLDQPIDPGDPETFNLVFTRRQNLTGFLDFRALLFDGVFFEGLKAAKVSVDLERIRSTLTKREIAINVTQAYLGVLIAGENQTIIKSNIETLDRLLFETRETYKAGFAESLDVSRLELSLENLKVEDENLTQMIELSKNILKFQMNYPLEKDIVLLDKLDVMLDAIQVAPQVILNEESIDYTNRPEVQVLEKSMELDDYDIRRLGLRWPTLKANINLQESLQRDKLFNSNEAGFIAGGYVGLKLDYAIFDGKLRESQQQRSKIRKEKTFLDLQNFKRGMYLQSTNAQNRLSTTKRTLENRKNILALTQEIYDKANIKFKEGVGSSVEVRQAETSLYQAQADYISAMYDVVLAKTDLDIALGNIK